MATVLIGEEQHEVSIEDITFGEGEIPKGFVTADHLSKEVQRRVASAKKNSRTELLADEDFAREILKAKGIELREDGSVKGSPKDIKEQEQEQRWQAQHLNPVKSQLDEATKMIETLRAAQRENEILKYADGVKPTLRDAFLRDAASRLALDEETGAWAIREKDGFRYTSDGKLAGAKELVEELRQSAPDWFASSRMTGSNLRGIDTAGKRTYTQQEIAQLATDPSKDLDTWRDMVAAQSEGRITA